MHELHLTLNPGGVAEPAKRIVIIATRAVGTIFRALKGDEFAELDPLEHGGFGYTFSGLEFSGDEWREEIERWVLAKGFQDLARGIRETLEEADLYLNLIKLPNGFNTTRAQIDAIIEKARTRSKPMQFPALMAEVNDQLNAPMNFTAQFLSIQAARNCLEHRGGIVGARDVDASGSLHLTFPRVKLFYNVGEEERELEVGKVIDTHDEANGLKSGQDVSIYMRLVDRARSFAVGERVMFTFQDFNEVALACQFFADDLATKLPVAPALAEDVRAQVTLVAR